MAVLQTWYEPRIFNSKLEDSKSMKQPLGKKKKKVVLNRIARIINCNWAVLFP